MSATGGLEVVLELDGVGTSGVGAVGRVVDVPVVLVRDGLVVPLLEIRDRVSLWAALILNGLSVYAAGFGDVVLEIVVVFSAPLLPIAVSIGLGTSQHRQSPYSTTCRWCMTAVVTYSQPGCVSPRRRWRIVEKNIARRNARSRRRR